MAFVDLPLSQSMLVTSFRLHDANCLDENGAFGGIRTPNLMFTKHRLCQLSYKGEKGASREWRKCIGVSFYYDSLNYEFSDLSRVVACDFVPVARRKM